MFVSLALGSLLSVAHADEACAASRVYFAGQCRAPAYFATKFLSSGGELVSVTGCNTRTTDCKGVVVVEALHGDLHTMVLSDTLVSSGGATAMVPQVGGYALLSETTTSYDVEDGVLYATSELSKRSSGLPTRMEAWGTMSTGALGADVDVTACVSGGTFDAFDEIVCVGSDCYYDVDFCPDGGCLADPSDGMVHRSELSFPLSAATWVPALGMACRAGSGAVEVSLGMASSSDDSAATVGAATGSGVTAECMGSLGSLPASTAQVCEATVNASVQGAGLAFAGLVAGSVATYTACSVTLEAEIDLSTGPSGGVAVSCSTSAFAESYVETFTSAYDLASALGSVLADTQCPQITSAVVRVAADLTCDTSTCASATEASFPVTLTVGVEEYECQATTSATCTLSGETCSCTPTGAVSLDDVDMSTCQ